MCVNQAGCLERNHGRRGWALGLLLVSLLPASGGDWTQYRGPDHDGISLEVIRTNWSETPPRELWRVPLPNGFSSITVSQGRVFTLYAEDVGGVTTEFCLALDADTGDRLWARPVGQVPSYSGTGVSDAPNGPRSTPVTDGARVYTYSAYLSLVCLAAENGQVLWTNNLVTAYGARNIGWENAASPVLHGDWVLVNSGATGQSLMAFDKRDGTLAWKGQTEAITHASPVLATLHGVRQTIFYSQTGLVSVAPDTGEVLWRHPVRYNDTSVGASPVVGGNRVYCSRAYAGSLTSAKAGALAVEVGFSGGAFNVTPLWFKTNQFMNHWSTPVQRDGYVYGLYGQWATGVLKCLDLATGTEQWSGPNLASGGVLLAGDYLLLLADNGELILAHADPTQYREIARRKILGRRCWNTPALSNGRIYARSTSEIVALDVAIPPIRLEAEPQTGEDIARDGFVFHMTDGAPGQYVAEWTTDLTAWNELGRLTFAGTPVSVTDPDAGHAQPRFYRIRQLP